MEDEIKITKDTFEKSKNLFLGGDPFGKQAVESIEELLNKSWLTKQYFSIGQNALVLPGWLHEQLIPEGRNISSFATSPVIVNSSGRNYYLLGHPESIHEPVVDYRGGVIPNPKSYTLLFGVLLDDKPVYNSEIGEIEVNLHEDGYPIVTVDWTIDGDKIIYECVAGVDEDGNESLAVNVLRGFQTHSLLVTIIPFDQDGLTSIDSIEFDLKSKIVRPADHPEIRINISPIKYLVLPAMMGSAGKRINHEIQNSTVKCECQAASWAGVFPVRSTPRLLIPLEGEDPEEPDPDDLEYDWEEEMEHLPEITTPDDLVNTLYRNSAIVLRSLSDIAINEITYGPSTQETMWYPALAFQMRALDRLGYGEKIVRPILNNILSNMTEEGLVDIQEQWDGYGSLVLAAMNHYRFHNEVNWIGERLNDIKKIVDIFLKMVKIEAKSSGGGSMGLLPRGNPPLYDPVFWKKDRYYVHDFYMLYILGVSAVLSDLAGRKGEVEKLKNDYDTFKNQLMEIVIEHASRYSLLPAGPDLQENAMMFFNLYGFYPLNIFGSNFTPLTKTLDQLEKYYMRDGGFMVFHPWNAFGSTMTIQMAQVFRFAERLEPVEKIIDFMVNNRTNDQGWAEGILNRKESGVVGDSPNGLVAAEWLNLILDIFADDKGESELILLKGMPAKWLEEGVSCKSLNIRGNGKLSYSAKVTGGTLKITFDYTGDLDVLVYLDRKVEKSKGAKNFQSNLYKLEKKKGTAEFQLG